MQYYQTEQDNLKSYITDLKKAAVGNKKTRGNALNVKGTANGAIVTGNKVNIKNN
jgi:hypothetical protein